MSASGDQLIAQAGEQQMGTVDYRDDRLTFRYEAGWQEAREAFPLSLSMPLTAREHPDSAIRPFLSGLLPDHPGVLERWGERFHVSAHNPFRLLQHVGEDCAGAVTFLRPDRLAAGKLESGITWQTEEEVTQRLHDVLNDHSATRKRGDPGQFSLAGAQPKIALFWDPASQRWGIPYGSLPTTHILKPATGEFKGIAENEHFCLRLAEHLGLVTAVSRVRRFGGLPVMVSERYDRRRTAEGEVARIHQEDFCQALQIPPGRKYQNQGGPSPDDAFSLIRDSSSQPGRDVGQFLDALIFNWLIAGTDAHGKNYSILLASGGQVRLAPFYDLVSILPYLGRGQQDRRDVTLAMKIGSHYKLRDITRRDWVKLAETCRLDFDGIVKARILKLATAIPDMVPRVRSKLGEEGLDNPVLEQLASEIPARAQAAIDEFGGIA